MSMGMGGRAKHPRMGGDDSRDLSLSEAVTQLAHFATVEIQPVSVFFGALAAQEVIKYATRRSVPVQQYCYVDMFAMLPEVSLRPDVALCFSSGTGAGTGGGSSSGSSSGRLEHLQS